MENRREVKCDCGTCESCARRTAIAKNLEKIFSRGFPPAPSTLLAPTGGTFPRISTHELCAIMKGEHPRGIRPLLSKTKEPDTDVIVQLEMPGSARTLLRISSQGVSHVDEEKILLPNWMSLELKKAFQRFAKVECGGNLFLLETPVQPGIQRELRFDRKQERFLYVTKGFVPNYRPVTDPSIAIQITQMAQIRSELKKAQKEEIELRNETDRLGWELRNFENVHTAALCQFFPLFSKESVLIEIKEIPKPKAFQVASTSQFCCFVTKKDDLDLKENFEIGPVLGAELFSSQEKNRELALTLAEKVALLEERLLFIRTETEKLSFLSKIVATAVSQGLDKNEQLLAVALNCSANDVACLFTIIPFTKKDAHIPADGKKELLLRHLGGTIVLTEKQQSVLGVTEILARLEESMSGLEELE